MSGQLALLGLAEFVLHLTRLNPEILQIERNSGLLSVFYFRFDVDETSGKELLQIKYQQLRKLTYN